MASPSAHGQAMMSTATAAVNDGCTPEPMSRCTANVPSDSRMTIGTKTAEMRSASRCTGALPDWASRTSRAMCASWVFAPTRVARTVSSPPAFTVPPTTRSPRPTSTGTDSPVIMDVSTAEAPPSISPSVAIFSPGRTRKTSPTASAPMGTVCSAPPRSTVTSLAPISASARSASPERRFARASK